MKPFDQPFPGGEPMERAYQNLPKAEPSAELDQAILRYAKASTKPGRGAWVWPVSMAAAIIVSVGIFSQMTHILPSGSYPRSPIVESEPREPRSVVASGEFDQSSAMQSQTIVVEVPGRSADEWINHLQDLAEQDNAVEFFQRLVRSTTGSTRITASRKVA